MQAVIDNVYEFNKKRDLLDNYDVKKEAALILEELLELFENENPRQLARDIIEKSTFTKTVKISDAEQIDAYIDIIYITIGSLIKKYKTIMPEGTNGNMKRFIIAFISRAIDNVCIANAAKDGYVDENGKFIKNSDFQEPFIPLTLQDLYENKKR